MAACDLEAISRSPKFDTSKKLPYGIIFQDMIAITWISLCLLCRQAKLQNGCWWPPDHYEVITRSQKYWCVQMILLTNHIPRYDSNHMNIWPKMMQTSQLTKWWLVTLIIRSRSPKFDTTQIMSHMKISCDVKTFLAKLLSLLCRQGKVWQHRGRRRRRRRLRRDPSQNLYVSPLLRRGRHN